MKKHYLLLVITVFISVFIQAQEKQSPFELQSLSETDFQKLASIPEYICVSGDHAATLPMSVDNTLQPYFRPLFNQSGLECGQAASIGLNFTYEIDFARNVAANTTLNQYATHFTYNFINGGSDAGVSYFETWEIVKRCGTPTSADYGGLSTGGASRWMTGYDKYYNAMHNRISDVYTIKAGDETGLNTLKNWIYNHSNTANVGGLANIYIQYKTPDAQLAAGTPEAGKWVITTWGGSPNHAVTLVGYNDSIRYDYNSDGQYTNHIDINGDGTVNMKDWEIGGFKLANTYGGINNWGNQGFSYVMYKTFADNLGSGGIWNHAAHIIKVKQDVAPKITYKITLKHTSRNKLKLMAGVSQNPLATEPDAVLNLPIFDLQGGDKYMLGGTTEADKTIEFGIDATPLLSEIEPGQAAKFFLMLSENDPSALATGEIISYSLVDYNGTTATIPCTISNLPVVQNGMTVMTITHTPNHNKPVITNTILPEAKIYEPYSQQLNATGGTPAYRWKLLTDYTETPVNVTFPTVNTQQLTVSGNTSGFAEVNLPFEFPFYGKKYSKVYAHVDGYLMFQPDLMPWTFIIYEKTFLKNTANISPYMSKPLTLYPAEGDGIWYEGNQDAVIFRWKSGMYNYGTSTDLNFAVKIFPDGKIEFYYGTIQSFDWIKWNAGFSNGDGVNYHFAAITDSLVQPASNSKFTFMPSPFPAEMTLSDDGVFSGTPSNSYNAVPISFYTEDNNNIFNTKTLTFSTKGINIEYVINSGGDSIVEYGETALLTAKLTNIGTTALHNVNLNFLVSDPYITLIDSTQTVGLLNPGQTVIIPDAIAFQVSEAVPDGYEIITTSQAVATEDIFTRTIPITAYSANLKITALSIVDGNNNVLMPGETGTLHVSISNTGGSACVNINALLSAIDPMINILQGSASIDTIASENVQEITFQVSVSAACPVGHIALAALHLSADKNYSANDSVYFNIGIIAEDFETGNFTRYPWQSSGYAPWIVAGNLPFEGTYCAVSPVIGDNQFSSLFVTMNVLCASEISFYRKTSSELNYDFLTFYIDGIEQGKWSGEVQWGKMFYAVTAGTHTFTWKYNKDANTVAGSDKAWVDYIIWPPYDDILLIANAGPDDLVCHPSAYTLQPVVINASTVSWSTSGDGYFSNSNFVDPYYYPGNSDLITGSVTLTIHASNASSQSVTDNISLNVFQSPIANAGADAAICSGESFTVTSATAITVQPLQWTSSGDGTFSNNYILSPVYSPGPADISNGEVFLILTAFGSVQCGSSSDSLKLTIHPAVFSDAGLDQTIPYGTSTQLNGQASGGTSSLVINWEPGDQLVYGGILNPFTLNLNSSVEFTLHITDPLTQCSSTDNVFVNVSGSPLSVNATAIPQRICLGSNSQLNAIAGGGTGIYTYSWTSVPPGFTSVIANPVVTPLVLTQYNVEVSDGSNTIPASVTIIVDLAAEPPSQPVGPEYVNVFLTPATNYTTTESPFAIDYFWKLIPAEAGTLQQTLNNCQVNWNPQFNGAALLSVAGINSCGTGEYSQALSIQASPLIGIYDQPLGEKLIVWPNPAKNIINIKSSLRGACRLSVFNSQGKVVFESGYTDITNHISLDLSELSTGIYILTLINGDNREMKRIVLTR
jgi:hypothetical protein